MNSPAGVSIVVCCYNSAAVIVPTLNSEETIGKLLNSIVDQEPHDKEILIVDDTDSNRVMLNFLLKSDYNTREACN